MDLNPIGSNQTEIGIKRGRVLFSYKTPVAAWIDGTYYRTEKNWSVTTSRHINKWLEGAEARKMPQAFFDKLA